MKICKRCKKSVDSFPLTKYGKASTMCLECYEYTAKLNAEKHDRAKQRVDAATGDAKVCMRCKKEKPIAEFEPNSRRKKGNGIISRDCSDCRRYAAEKAEEYRGQWSAEKKRAAQVYNRDRSRDLRQKLLEAYGAKCKCCGETQREFLAIDHVNNDGFHHRRNVVGYNSEGLYLWAQKRGFPDSLQCLCHNCNVAKAYFGKCPHEAV